MLSDSLMCRPFEQTTLEIQLLKNITKKRKQKIINHAKENILLHICETTVLRLILKGKHFSCLGFQFKFCEKVQNLNTGISRTAYLGSCEVEFYQQ